MLELLARKILYPLKVCLILTLKFYVDHYLKILGFEGINFYILVNFLWFSLSFGTGVTSYLKIAALSFTIMTY